MSDQVQTNPSAETQPQPVPRFLNAFLFDEANKNVGQIFVTPHEFRTGSKGFFGQGKLDINGRRYQVQVQVVEIGSKGG